MNVAVPFHSISLFHKCSIFYLIVAVYVFKFKLLLFYLCKKIYISASGSTGKTFLSNLILAEIRAQGEVALVMVSSGIKAMLIKGGRTAHSALIS